jgi:hypothetical protein
MSRDDFYALFELIEPYLPRRPDYSWEYDYKEVLLAVLRLLAEGCTYDAAARFAGLRSKSLIEHYMNTFLQAIISAVMATKGKGSQDCSISFPETADEIALEKNRWVMGRHPTDQRYAALQGCIGAGDGTLIPVLVKNDPSFSLEAHRSRKGKRRGLGRLIICSSNFFDTGGTPYYNCLAVAGARRNFLFFNVGAEGCAHDSQVIDRSGLERLIPPESFILFDAGGPLLRGKILTPYKGSFCVREMF